MGKKIVTSNSFVTTTNGELTVKLYTEGNRSEIVSSLVYYSTELKYKVSKEGYYPKSGSVSSGWDGGMRNRRVVRLNLRYNLPEDTGLDTHKPVETEKIVLIRPTDYFDKGFVSDISVLELKEKVITFKEKNTFSLSLTT